MEKMIKSINSEVRMKKSIMAVIGQITPGMKMHLADWLSGEKITEKTGGKLYIM